jgi:hypothetical protein
MNNTDQYALDTARAKTPAERLRIVADLMEAQERGELIYWINSTTGTLMLDDGNFGCTGARLGSTRYVTKRRPALVIPALELFELPMTEAPQIGQRYYVPRADKEEGYEQTWWEADDIDADCMRHGICFATPEAAARIGLHIRNEPAKAVAR